MRPFIARSARSNQLQTLANHMDVPGPKHGAPGILALAEPWLLQSKVETPGLQDVELEGLEELEIDVLEVADGKAYRAAFSDLAAPVVTLVNQLEDSDRQRYIDEVITTADSLRQCETPRIRATTWIVSAST